MTKVLVRKLRPDAVVPKYMTPGAAGMDLCVCLPCALIPLRPGKVTLVYTGVALAIPRGFEGQIRPRSSLAIHGITIPNAPGTIDSDYRGEIGVLLHNQGDVTVPIKHGRRIAQLVIAPIVHADIELADELPPSERGHGGFGSTGR